MPPSRPPPFAPVTGRPGLRTVPHPVGPNGSLQSRAQRLDVRALATLQLGRGHEEVVLIHDMSVSGVRLSIERCAPLAICELLEATLHVRVAGSAESRDLRLAVELVRVSGYDEKRVVLGFRFRAGSKVDPVEIKQLRGLLRW